MFSSAKKAIAEFSKRQKEAGQIYMESVRTPEAAFAQKITVIETKRELDKALKFLQENRLSHIGIATDHRFSQKLCAGVTLYPDIRSIEPNWLFLAAVVEEQDNDSNKIFQFAVRLTEPSGVSDLGGLFAMHTMFAGHDLKETLFCLRQIVGDWAGLRVWDTYICEKFFQLGLFHKRYLKNSNQDLSRQIRNERELKESAEEKCSIDYSCNRYGISYAAELNVLANSLSVSPPMEARKKAVTAAMLYHHQVNQAVRKSALEHLVKVEMPWVVTNARMEWGGVHIDPDTLKNTKKILDKESARFKGLFSKYGLENPNSQEKLIQFFDTLSLLSYFKDIGPNIYHFDKDQLKKNRHKHPLIECLLVYRKIADQKSHKIFTAHMIGKDGRVHPRHIQLGAHTGRQTCTIFNVMGLSKETRPLIAAPEGYGIFEADWSQVEVGIAGAVYNDSAMIEMYNTGDTYSAMAQVFYRNELPKQALEMGSLDFKAQYPDKRKIMKACTLSLLYGVSSHGLSDMLGESEPKAQSKIEQFSAMFPDFEKNSRIAVARSSNRGYAEALGEVRRYRAKTGAPTRWEKNWLKNHPVQGSGAIVFKAAGNRIDKMLRNKDARILVPLHDSFVIETPLIYLEEIADNTVNIMKETMVSYFPELSPKVDINKVYPGCWNKDSNINSLELLSMENDKIINQVTPLE